MSFRIKLLILLLVAVLIITGKAGAQLNDLNIVHSETKVITDADGTVRVRIDYLQRPGEMSLTIDYDGFLTQEGMVNFYLMVNGEIREFSTMKQELKNRSQRIRILSFHPTVRENNINRLADLSDGTVVDNLLFRNAPYYQQFGALNVEVKFFIHSRWDGDSNNNNENFKFSFTSPITDMPKFHF